MGTKPLSAGIADTARIVDAVAEGYAHATEALSATLARIPDGCIAVGAMDGFTAVVPAPATLAHAKAASRPDVAPTAA